MTLKGLTQAQNDTARLLTDLLPALMKEVTVVCAKRPGGIRVRYDGKEGRIEYEQEHQLWRALGLFCESFHIGTPFDRRETPCVKSLGVMLDCSRNAVLHQAAFRRLVPMLALMGYSHVQLYMEDTFEVEGYPYFGYKRGRYTREELKEMDEFAARFCIELIPAVQTLGHFARVLQWDAFSELRDTEDILLCKEEKTYALIDAMFSSLSKSLRSRRLNIGMDEAHLVGLGKYLDRHGYQDRLALMLEHFERVYQIAKKYGYQVMLWSDMFFRLASKGEYYSPDCALDKSIAKRVPKDTTLIYWDYYSESGEIYDGMLRRHLELSPNIAFAGGAWKWMGYAPNSAFSERVGRLAFESCKRHNIQEIFVTAWGDNGAECPLTSVLPAFQLWAELCYTGGASGGALAARFESCTGGVYEDFMRLGELDLTPGNPSPGKCSCNPSKYLLYQDSLLPLFDRHITEDEELVKHYDSLSREFSRAAGRNKGFWALFSMYAALCRVLARKSTLSLRIRRAYEQGDHAALLSISQREIPEIIEAADGFQKCYRRQWSEENKIYGLEVFDLRLGGLCVRLQSAAERIERYASGELSEICELSEDMLYFDERNKGALCAPFWHRIVTPGGGIGGM